MYNTSTFEIELNKYAGQKKTRTAPQFYLSKSYIMEFKNVNTFSVLSVENSFCI